MRHLVTDRRTSKELRNIGFAVSLAFAGATAALAQTAAPAPAAKSAAPAAKAEAPKTAVQPAKEALKPGVTKKEAKLSISKQCSADADTKKPTPTPRS